MQAEKKIDCWSTKFNVQCIKSVQAYIYMHRRIEVYSYALLSA
jgi:hypothetical protein